MLINRNGKPMNEKEIEAVTQKLIEVIQTAAANLSTRVFPSPYNAFQKKTVAVYKSWSEKKIREFVAKYSESKDSFDYQSLASGLETRVRGDMRACASDFLQRARGGLCAGTLLSDVTSLSNQAMHSLQNALSGKIMKTKKTSKPGVRVVVNPYLRERPDLLGFLFNADTTGVRGGRPAPEARKKIADVFNIKKLKGFSVAKESKFRQVKGVGRSGKENGYLHQIRKRVGKNNYISAQGEGNGYHALAIKGKLVNKGNASKFSADSRPVLMKKREGRLKDFDKSYIAGKGVTSKIRMNNKHGGKDSSFEGACDVGRKKNDRRQIKPVPTSAMEKVTSFQLPSIDKSTCHGNTSDMNQSNPNTPLGSSSTPQPEVVFDSKTPGDFTLGQEGYAYYPQPAPTLPSTLPRKGYRVRPTSESNNVKIPPLQAQYTSVDSKAFSKTIVLIRSDKPNGSTFVGIDRLGVRDTLVASITQTVGSPSCAPVPFTGNISGVAPSGSRNPL